jgi:hypothetical protein
MEILHIIKTLLKQNNCDTLVPQQILMLLNLVLNHNYFECDKKCYKTKVFSVIRLFQEVCQWWIKMMCCIYSDTGLSAHISLYSLKMAYYCRPQQINNTVQQVGIDSLWVELAYIWRRAPLCFMKYFQSLKSAWKQKVHS